MFDEPLALVSLEVELGPNGEEEAKEQPGRSRTRELAETNADQRGVDVVKANLGPLLVK